MKRLIIAVCLLALSQPAFASKIIPPRMAVRWLIQAVQADQTNGVADQFGFDAKKHGTLTLLSRDEQLRLLKDLPVDKLKFDKSESAIDGGRRFVVKLVEPVELEFEIEYVELRGDLGPPLKYVVIAIRKTAQPTNTVVGVVIEKRANVKSFESWNSPSDPYYVLDMGNVTETYVDGTNKWQATRKQHVTLRPSDGVPTEKLSSLRGKQVQLRGRYVEGEPYKPADHTEQVPMEPEIRTKADGTPVSTLSTHLPQWPGT